MISKLEREGKKDVETLRAYKFYCGG